MTTFHRAHLAAALALVVGMAACSGGEDTPPSETESPVTEDGADASDPEPTAPEPTAPDPTDTETPADGGDADTPPDAGAEDQGPPPLTGEPTTGRSTQDPTAGVLAVTDVRIASHDGFDRVVFDIGGDGEGTVGWNIEYVDAPTSQGSGNAVDVEGNAHLSVSLTGVTLPPELPADLEAYTEDTDGPPGSAVTEVVSDTIFEGHHQFFVGLEEQRPYVVQRLSDPQRVVIDLFDR